MIGIVVAVVVAALVYFLCLALGLPALIGVVAAVLVVIAGVPTRSDDVGGRWGGRRGL